MNFRTGQTIYEEILSLDPDNAPLSAATFDAQLFKDGLTYTNTPVTMTLGDATRGIFVASYVLDSVGIFQLYVKNYDTCVVFISDPVNVRPDSDFDQTIYVGL